MLQKLKKWLSPIPEGDYQVTFATICWEKDWELILKKKDYLAKNQIARHLFPFARKTLIINNVKDYPLVLKEAQKMVEEGVLTDVYIAKDISAQVLDFFHLKEEDFRAGVDRHLYQGVDDKWIYYNAIGPLSAIYTCKTDYLLYHTGDVWLKDEIDWIPQAIEQMQKDSKFKVANLTWNEKYQEAKKESYKKKNAFYAAKSGFSDQQFLVKASDFQKPIYGEIRKDAAHYPRGDVFEKRVFSYMKNHGWERLTFAKGSYMHECFDKLEQE